MPTKMEDLSVLRSRVNAVCVLEAEIAMLDQQIAAAPVQQQQQQQQQPNRAKLIRDRDAAYSNLPAAWDALVDAAALALRVTLPAHLPLDGANYLAAAEQGASVAFTGLLHLVVWNGNLTTIERRLHNRQWLGHGWALAWLCLTLLNLPAWLLVWCGIPPYTRWMQLMLFLLFASLASSLAWVFEFTPLNGAQHALAVVGTLAGAAGLFATYDLPLRSTDIAGLRAAITQAGDLEVQLQARGLLRLKYLVTAVRYKLQRTAADAAVRLDMLLSRLSG